MGWELGLGGPEIVAGEVPGATEKWHRGTVAAGEARRGLVFLNSVVGNLHVERGFAVGVVRPG